VIGPTRVVLDTGDEMADDHSQRFYHPDDPPARGSSAGTPEPRSGSDPLAELARLIGQNDPFGEFGREGSRRSMPPHPKPATDWRPHAEDLSYAPATAAHEPDPFHAQHHDYAEPEATDFEASRYYASDVHQDGEAEDVYDDSQARRRRLGIVAIVAVFALAVIGTAGAFTYRAVYHTGASKPPPVIKADVTPSKVVPEVKSKDTQSAKLIYDRVNDRAQPERIVSREERPVELRDKPAGVLSPAQDEHGPLLGNGVVGAEPKKIHTIAIRPENGGPVGSAPAVAAPPPPRAQSAPAVVATREPPTVSPPATRSVAPPAASRGPMSLSPNENAAAPARAATAPARTAAVTPAQPAPAASAVSHGAYVQVSSQRSEADAQASFRGLQAKYPSQLGGKPMTVHRADLGAKGVYYRVLVGPFANANDATDLCGKLKTAGGNCLIQRN
jgi:SPOR domain